MPKGYVARAMTGDKVPGPLARAFDYGTYRLVRWYGLQPTGGSMSVRTMGRFGMTVAGAAAREMILAAAAARFGAGGSDLTIANSVVRHAASGRTATLGERASDAAKQSVPSRPTPKSPDAYALRRTARPRFDLPSKVDGTAVYGIDFTLPGMLHAAVEIVPVFGGKLVSVDPKPAESMRGVKRVVMLGEAVAVVADSCWHARTALDRLQPRFDDAGHGGVSSRAIFAAFDQALGPPPAMPADAATVVTADYQVPFPAHPTMEPMACTALGGGFGHRLPFSLDFIGMSARIAKAMSPAPVKMIWSRETDVRRDYYRPAAMARFAGALDAKGAPLAVACHYAGGGDAESVFLPYAIADTRAEGRDAAHPIRTGSWRSVLDSQHGFFKESFIDELAHAAGADPFVFRRDLLGNEPCHRAVLERVAAMADWGSPLPEGEGRGMALVECFGSRVGEVAHVAVSPEGVLRVTQVEGGIIFALSAAWLGEITIAEGRDVEGNFHDYEMIRLADAPRISVDFIRSGPELGGLGEPGVPPIAAAVTNAISAARGIRVRTLPIRNTSLATVATAT